MSGPLAVLGALSIILVGIGLVFGIVAGIVGRDWRAGLGVCAVSLGAGAAAWAFVWLLRVLTYALAGGAS